MARKGNYKAGPGRPKGQLKVANEKQRWYCYQYMIHGDKRRAASEAGYSVRKSPGYLDRLHNHPAVQAFLAQLRAEKEAEFDGDSNRVRQLLWKRGTVNPGAIHLKLQKNNYDMSCLSFEESMLIAGWEVKEVWEGRGKYRHHAYNIIKIKLHDPETAWDKLNRMAGAYTDNLNVNDDAATLLRAKIEQRRKQRREKKNAVS